MTTDGRTSSTQVPRDPLGRLVEVAVFAPLGLAVTVVQGQRVAVEQVGRIAVRAGRVGCAAAAEAVRRVREEVEEQVRADRERSELARLTGSRGRSRPTSRSRRHRPDADDADPDVAGDAPRKRRVADPERGAGAAPVDDPGDEGVEHDVDDLHDLDDLDDLDAADLALPDYDHLPASQIVTMLDDLVATERDDIERYERVNRGRRTVLGKLDQLRRSG